MKSIAKAINEITQEQKEKMDAKEAAQKAAK